MSDAISAITGSAKFDPDTTTLKLIVFPEFMMRGTKGAYDRNRLATYFQQIQKLSTRGDVLVVIGSALLYSHAPSDNSEFYHTGDHLLDVYYRLHSRSDGSFAESGDTGSIRMKLHNLLSAADGKEDEEAALSTANDEPFDDILVKTLDYSDEKATQVIENLCYATNSSFFHLTIKKFKSKEDFVLNSHPRGSSASGPLFLQTTTKYPEITEDKNNNTGTFLYGGIRFGVEICLDHKRGRLKNLGIAPVDIQLIPSCGMTIHPESIVVRDGGYVFNCDGEYELSSGSTPGGVNGQDSHTSLCGYRGGRLTNIYNVIQDMRRTFSGIKDLYRNEYYNIHFYEPVNL